MTVQTPALAATRAAHPRVCARPGCSAARPRWLIVPGLHDSGPAHWQSWLQRRARDSRRVQQADWHQPDLEGWSDRIADTLAAEPPGPWLAVAHSFGCLAVLAHLARTGVDADAGQGVVAALLVAPADPRRFGLEQRLARRVPLDDCTVLASSSDPWLPTHLALPWAHVWGARLIDLGDAGHVNAEAGYGPWPRVQQLAEQANQRCVARHRAGTEALDVQVRGLRASARA
jgi:predicted alpha/beta hydrolase family esterase